jgi:Acetoacetate decarboxylase (ADC)/Flavin containing amine oxidoreductase
VRENVRGSDRYVTTYAGSVKYRLAPDESGLTNAALAGDWTRNGIDGGCMEAAAASGRLAARAISGLPATVPGTMGWLADDGWAAGGGTFVEYGGLTTIPSPYRSENATLHGFWARADGTKLDALCRRVFAEPSGGAADFRAIGEHIMVTWGQIPTVSSLDPAFSDLGSVDENQVAVWVPVVRVREQIPGVPVPESFAMFVPYIWLNNPMSLTTGREVLGYAKSWGVPRFAAAGADAPFGLDAFGLREDGDQAGLHPLLAVTGEGDEAARGGPLLTLHDVVWHAVAELLPGGVEHLDLGFALPAELLADIAGNRLRSVFLKQIRAVEGASSAALQQITETSYIVRRLRAWPLSGPYRLAVHPMVSQPLARELGLEDQTLDLAYRCEMDFDVRDSRVLWQP